MERYVIELSRLMTIQDVAQHTGLGWDTVKQIIKGHLQRRYSRPSLKGLKQRFSRMIRKILRGHERSMEFYDYLMEQLLRYPIAFEERGDGNFMLKAHVEGEPVERLRPLLVSDDPAIRRTAMFVTNELGYLAEPLIDEITLLISDKDLHVQWEAIEAIMGLSRRSNCERFVHVASALESSSMPICKLAMRLIIRANRGQIEAAINSGSALSERHKQGLRLVLADQSHGTREVTRLLDSSDSVTRRYGAIVAVLNMENCPDLVRIASENSDEVVAIFATEAISDPWRHQNLKENDAVE